MRQEQEAPRTSATRTAGAGRSGERTTLAVRGRASLRSESASTPRLSGSGPPTRRSAARPSRRALRHTRSCCGHTRSARAARLGPRTALRCAWVVCPAPPLGPLTPRPLPSAGAGRRGRDRARQEGRDRAPRRQSAGAPQAHRRERAGGAALSELAGVCDVSRTCHGTPRWYFNERARGGRLSALHCSQTAADSGGRTCARKNSRMVAITSVLFIFCDI